jgi:hypothetical protein
MFPQSKKKPLKMELTEGSETLENHNLTPGKYQKEYIQYLILTLGTHYTVGISASRW